MHQAFTKACWSFGPGWLEFQIVRPWPGWLEFQIFGLGLAG